MRTPFAVELSVDMRVLLAGCRWLSSDSAVMMGTACWPPNEDAACFCFSCRGDDVLQVFSNDLYVAVERRASGGGVAGVDDAGDATACLGEEEVSCV